MLVELIIAGNRFELPGLLDKCLAILRNQVSLDNASDILIVADKHRLEDFKKVAIEKINFQEGYLY